MLAGAADALSSADRKELDRLERQSRPETPLWDGQEILPRPNVQAMDDGDNVPASWDPDTTPSMATEAGQPASSPHTPTQGTAAGPSMLHRTAFTGSTLGSKECNQSGSTSPAANSTAASSAELEAKMAMLQQRIAAKKAAAKVAAKARNASGDPSTASSRTAPDQAVEAQAKSMPPHAEPVTVGPPDPAPTGAKLPKVSGTVYSSSTNLLHSGDTHEGIQPASSHSPRQLCVPRPCLSSSSSTVLPVSDFGHGRADATASSCRSELPGYNGQSHDQAVGHRKAATSADAGDTQLAASTDSKQAEETGTGSVASELPAAATQTAVTGSDQGRSGQGHVDRDSSTSSPQACLPSVYHKQDEQEAQNSQDSQAHLDSSSWLVLLGSQGMSSDVPAIGSIASRLSDNTAFHAAADTPLPGQNQEQVRSGSQPDKTSCAVAAMNITAGRLEVMQRHAPLVLQEKAANEAHRNPKPAVPIESERPDKSVARELLVAQVEQKMTSVQGVHTATMASEAYPKQAVNDVILRQLQAGSFWADTRDSATPMDIDVTLS